MGYKGKSLTSQFTESMKLQKKISQLSPPTLKSLKSVMSPLPTIAQGAANAASSIVNGTVYNTVVGGTVNPIFRYPHGDIRVSGGTFPDTNTVSNFAVSNPVSGTFAAGNHRGAIVVTEFQVDGTQFEFYLKGVGQKYRILVDDGSGMKYTTASTGYHNGSFAGDGSFYRVLVTFPSRAPRNIRLEIEQGNLQSVTVGPNDTLSPSTIPLAPKCVVVGDSFTEPTGATNGFTGWGTIACDLLGWEASVSGSGGTGYLATPNAWRVPFSGRVQTDIINQKPQYVIIAGGINDSASTDAQVQAAATSLYKTIQAALPETIIIVISNWTPKIPGAAELSRASALKTAALNCGIAYIDTLNGTSYTPDGTKLMSNLGSWMTGSSGNTGTPAASGNASMYTGPDGTHPAAAGHIYLGQRVAAEVHRILNWYGRYN
jgi:lysophospholipase L1-like esterase